MGRVLECVASRQRRGLRGCCVGSAKVPGSQWAPAQGDDTYGARGRRTSAASRPRERECSTRSRHEIVIQRGVTPHQPRTRRHTLGRVGQSTLSTL
eukprot:7383574-Prymnesium_polylepis.4